MELHQREVGGPKMVGELDPNDPRARAEVEDAKRPPVTELTKHKLDELE